MSTTTTARGDLRAHHEATSLPTTEIVGRLRELLGATLVAYLGQVKETRAVRQWADGDRVPPNVTTTRLRTAYHAAVLLAEKDTAGVVQAWFQGMNPQMDDHAPAWVLVEQPIEQAGPAVIAAARSFAAQG